MLLDIAWRLMRPLLFRLDAEEAHHLVISMLGRHPRMALRSLAWLGPQVTRQPVDIGDIRWASPVGLAAGLDKDAQALPLWEALGFGAIEVGTVTPRPQPGNPSPRLFRLVPEQALINRMGFNNAGAQAMAARLGAWGDAGLWPRVPVGANIGRNKTTSNEDATDDYVASVLILNKLVDWFTVNVSSPNTPELRALLAPEPLARLLDGVVEAAAGVPVWLKISPDLTPDELARVVEVAVGSGCAAIVATNTTVSRPANTGRLGESGGLSGGALWPLARARIEQTLAAADGRLPIVGVGGVDSVERMDTLRQAGCAAVQVYSGLIFKGPGLASTLTRPRPALTARDLNP